MDWTDRLFSLLGIAGLVIFLSVIVWFVPRVDLSIVFGIAVLMAIYDLLVYPAIQRRARDRAREARRR